MEEKTGRYPWIEKDDEEKDEEDSEDVEFHEKIKEYFKSFADEVFEF